MKNLLLANVTLIRFDFFHKWIDCLCGNKCLFFWIFCQICIFYSWFDHSEISSYFGSFFELFNKPGTGKLWFCYVCAKLNSFCLSRSTFVCKIKNLLEEKLCWQIWQVTGLIELWAVPIVNFQVWFVSKLLWQTRHWKGFILLWTALMWSSIVFKQMKLFWQTLHWKGFIFYEQLVCAKLNNCYSKNFFGKSCIEKVWLCHEQPLYVQLSICYRRNFFDKPGK